MNDQHESDHVRDVYAHFGLAIYLAQCLEQSIFQHLLFFDHFPKAVAEFKSKDAWIDAFDAFEARELGHTMGKLIRRIKDVGKPTEVIQALLSGALEQRNWLAHRYFSDRAVSFTQESGRDAMIAELGVIQTLFRDTAREIDALTMPTAKKYGLTDEALEKVMAEIGREQDT
ncbi:hypothetical protein [Caballeronia sp. LjRoot31]|uniref:hypothetical protein n=1 Tax=Caballeronia sp. LjRoot31 TaxID=3342324 RepID=UPI003ECE25CC